jgi:predicted ATPase
VGYEGEHTISALLAAKERKMNTGRKKRTRHFQQLIAEQLHQLQLIDGFEVRQISANRKEYEVKIKTPGAPDWVDLPDVGFGISQVLPVVVQSFYAAPHSILFIEQPELHLHPKAQANLADLFIDVLASWEQGQPRGVQLIIETHSEHFLNRLQRRIAEGAVVGEDIACYFAHTTGTESKLDALKMDMFGNIENWPPEFFGDSMGDLMAMQRIAAEKRAKNSNTAAIGR